VNGRPSRHWITWFLLCHQWEGAGYRRLEWPDGRPLREQSWPLAVGFRIIAGEFLALARERGAGNQHLRG
jgi:hypothetical protein